MLHPAEIGAHLICHAGKPVQEFGIVPEHLIILGFFIDDIVVDLAPAFLEQGSALDLYIISLVLDGIVQRPVDTGGDDLDLTAVIDFGIACTLVGFGPFRNIKMVRVAVKIVETVVNILTGIILKPALI